MKLDVVVPTYNRSALLRKTIESLLLAPAPDGLDVTLIVVDNNCIDNTSEVVEEIQQNASKPLIYVKQPLQGLSNARNAGIAAGTSELVGVIDDDEEIDSEWFNTVAREFADPGTMFIGGPYLPNCELPMPSWLPPGYNGAIGVIQPKPRVVMDGDFPGNLQGGNAVFRREVFEHVGLYNTKLGRSGKGLLSDEDAEFYRRLLAAGMRGFHVPDLIIYHHIPAERLTRRYHRNWCLWRGVSQGVVDRSEREPVAYFIGIPRWRIREAIRGLFAFPFNLTSKGSGASFSRELPLWTLAGFIYGRFFAKIEKFYAAKS